MFPSCVFDLVETFTLVSLCCLREIRDYRVTYSVFLEVVLIRALLR